MGWIIIVFLFLFLFLFFFMSWVWGIGYREWREEERRGEERRGESLDLVIYNININMRICIDSKWIDI